MEGGFIAYITSKSQQRWRKKRKDQTYRGERLWKTGLVLKGGGVGKEKKGNNIHTQWTEASTGRRNYRTVLLIGEKRCL